VEKLARYVDKEEKIRMKLIVSAHVLERLSHVASTRRRERESHNRNTYFLNG
jgi:hypothetical protein